jgi:hypothetical protein
MGKNVMIPRSVLDSIIEFVELSDIENRDDYRVRCDCHYLLKYLIWKQQKSILRDSYSKIIRAESKEAKEEARKLYLHQRQVMKWENENMAF